VFGRGAHEEDGPANWEIPFIPWERSGRRGAWNKQSPTGARERVTAYFRIRISTRPEGRPTARGTGAEAEGAREVGGLNTSDDVGELGGARTRPSKGSPC
jgi:hypothetical protein